VNPRFAGALPGVRARGLAVEPWVRGGGADAAPGARPGAAFAQFAYWYRASDFESFGHTLRFASVPDLLRLAAARPLEELAAASVSMRREWLSACQRTEASFALAAEGLLRTLGPSAVVGGDGDA